MKKEIIIHDIFSCLREEINTSEINSTRCYYDNNNSIVITFDENIYDITIKIEIPPSMKDKGDSLFWSHMLKYSWITKDEGTKKNQSMSFLQFESPIEGVFYAEIIRHKPWLDSLRIEIVEDGLLDLLKECNMSIMASDMYNMTDYYCAFENHLNDGGNKQVFLSAPFGTGKSTFINYFFDKYKDRYDVVHLYPVNYAVASNEDIMEYIKARLLGELLSRGVVLEENDFGNWIYMHQWLLENLNNPKAIVNVLDGFLKLFPSIDPTGAMFSKVVPVFQKLNKSFKSFKKKHKQNSESEQTKDFFKKIKNKKGSLYDQGFIRQLLISLVERNRVENGKDQVLVIDDLDRMDPEHIFRIMNVLAAHFDHEDFNNGNKFGFDKVILVGDYNNIRHIYQHKYGDRTDFAGYINKFFSRGIFSYGLNLEVDPLGTSIAKELECQLLRRLVPDMYRCGALNIREYRRLWGLKDRFTQKRKDFIILQCERAYELFMQIMDHESLMQRLKLCQQMVKQFPDNYHICDSYHQQFFQDMKCDMFNLFLYFQEGKLSKIDERYLESKKQLIVPNIEVPNVSYSVEIEKSEAGYYLIAQSSLFDLLDKYYKGRNSYDNPDEEKLSRMYIYDKLIEIFNSFKIDNNSLTM